MLLKSIVILFNQQNKTLTEFFHKRLNQCFLLPLYSSKPILFYFDKVWCSYSLSISFLHTWNLWAILYLMLHHWSILKHFSKLEHFKGNLNIFWRNEDMKRACFLYDTINRTLSFVQLLILYLNRLPKCFFKVYHFMALYMVISSTKWNTTYFVINGVCLYRKTQVLMPL